MFISWKVYFLINWELSTKHVDTYPYRRDFFWSLQKLHALPLLSCVFFHKKVGLCDVKIFLFIIESTFLHLQSITRLLGTYFLWLQFFHILPHTFSPCHFSKECYRITLANPFFKRLKVHWAHTYVFQHTYYTTPPLIIYEDVWWEKTIFIWAE